MNLALSGRSQDAIIDQQDGRTRRAANETEWFGPGWFTPVRFSFLLGLFIFASFPQVLLSLETFVVRDFGFFAYPLAHYQRESFWRGELPLWNPFNFCGVPFLAQWNTMPLYPPALIYLILPLRWSLSFFCLLHLFWAGLGMYLLAYRWTGHRFAAAVAGLLFAFNGFSLNLLMWPSHIATLSWMPWVILLVERAWMEGGRKCVGAALVGALQMLAGGPETILFTWLLLSALWLGRVAQVFRNSGRAPADLGTQQQTVRLSSLLWRFPIVVGLVSALAAAQLLPFLDLTAHSQRQVGYADSRWALPPWGWVNFLVPMAFGRTWTTGIFFQHFQSWTSSYYLGCGALVLGLLGLGTVRSKRVWLLASVAGVGLVLAFGDRTVVYRWLGRLIPQLSLMTNPVKFVTFVVFAVPLLAAYGIVSWQRAPVSNEKNIERRLIVISGCLLVLIAGILAWAKFFPLAYDEFPATLRNGFSRAGFLVATTVLLLVWRRNSRPKFQAIMSLALLALFWLDVLTHEPVQNPSVPTWVYQPGLARAKLAMNPQPSLGGSRAMITAPADLKLTQSIISSLKDNFLVKRLGYFANCNLLDEVPKVNGFFSLCPRECDELNTVLYAMPYEDFPHLNDFMSVSQITAPDKSFDWVARDTFLPLVTAGQKPLFLNDSNSLSGICATNFDATKLVLLPLDKKPFVSVTNRTKAQVLSTKFSAHRAEAEVEAAETSLVVFSQTYYHLWRATVDDRPVPLLRANYAFQAVQVPAGRHRVKVTYEDRNFRAGAMISGLALAGCCLGGWKRSKKAYTEVGPIS